MKPWVGWSFISTPARCLKPCVTCISKQIHLMHCVADGSVCPLARPLKQGLKLRTPEFLRHFRANLVSALFIPSFMFPDQCSTLACASLVGRSTNLLGSSVWRAGRRFGVGRGNQCCSLQLLELLFTRDPYSGGWRGVRSDPGE